MQFFDLNIAYLDGEKSITNKSPVKQNRLKLIVKAMELGYSGIAYNRTIKGAMSESDRCIIPPFPLSSLLNASPSLSSTVKFHRRLLGVSDTSPFRQYTRMTVVVETSAQAAALNSGNPVLKTYDLVAVRPLNQNSFDQACQSSQVDLISIDFAERLPFRLKLPMVKAAIARGVYFEITYSSLMGDIQMRRQMISNAKLLVEWTRGKNLIISSGAPSVLELRGPTDVANLSSLLGLSDERAKAAISKNCRSLVTNALRKKQFHKEAIRVEVMPAGAQTDPKQPWIADYLDWDPISSGEGDLLLDDMARSFAKSGKVSQNVKAIDFASIVNSVPSHGFLVKDIGFTVEGTSHSSDCVMDFVSASKASKENEKLQKEPTSFHSSLLDQQGNADEKSKQWKFQDSANAFSILKGLENSSTSFLPKLEKSDVLETKISLSGSHETELQNLDATHSEDMLVSRNIKEKATKDVGCTADSREDISVKGDDLDCLGEEADLRQPISGLLSRIEAGVSTDVQLGDQPELSPSSVMSMRENLLHLKEDSILDINSTIHADKKMGVDSFGDISLLGDVAKEQDQKEDSHANVRIDTEESVLADTVMPVDSFPERDDGDDPLVIKPMLSEDMIVEARKQVEDFDKAEYQSLGEIKSGNHKVKRLASGQVPRFPFKRFLQVQFKRKGSTSMYKTKKR